MRRRRDRLGIVDHSRTTIETDHGREGRLDPRNPALALKRLHQRRLFANLISARTRLRDEVEVDTAPKNIFAKKTLRISIRDSFLNDLQQIAILAAQIDKPKFRPNRKT